MAGLPRLLSKIVLLDGFMIVLENSRYYLSSRYVCTQKTDNANHCPTAICFFSFFRIIGIIFYQLRGSFTRKNVLLAILSDYLRRRCHLKDLENARNNLPSCCICAEGCNEAKHCCPTIEFLCFWSHNKFSDYFVNKCKPIINLCEATVCTACLIKLIFK